MTAVKNKAEDIMSKEYLDKALENAKSWCSQNFVKHFPYCNDIDYGIFRYIIDNGGISFDMWLDYREEGLIRVSTEKLKWYLEREEFIGRWGFTRYARRDDGMIFIKGAVEVDPESMFVHEIAEYVIHKNPDLYLYCLSKNQSSHFAAHQLKTSTALNAV